MHLLFRKPLTWELTMRAFFRNADPLLKLIWADTGIFDLFIKLFIIINESINKTFFFITGKDV
ncbi:hypothetical protein EO98_02885 [Methanosarcina sp. 2.H.T.1A.6]|nr:hypothetical protein EO94_03225 [Methanosarcina sp. 2.H.T.1A.3]KKG20408.1 hypothetical protein EO96_06380 [Methanosarcina sp. 2.H.T.1A.8]KKG22493.1 hypothetical protein EO98_02885 [Methanosarcina sp. 2.H.T.1A.6]KKG23485.1 hypothetical protein EO97_17235 [Methanosarcina sp. 2.H.T.1A.15]